MTNRDIRTQPLGWGNNTQYDMFPQYSPFETYHPDRLDSTKAGYDILRQLFFSQVKSIENFTGRPQDQVLFMLGQIVSILSCFLLKKLESPAQRQFFATVAGIVICFYTFGFGALISFVMNIICFVMF